MIFPAASTSIFYDTVLTWSFLQQVPAHWLLWLILLTVMAFVLTTEQQYQLVIIMYWGVLVQGAPVLPQWCGSGMENRWLMVAGSPSLRQCLVCKGPVNSRSPTLLYLMLECTSVSSPRLLKWSLPYHWDWTQVSIFILHNDTLGISAITQNTVLRHFKKPYLSSMLLSVL